MKFVRRFGTYHPLARRKMSLLDDELDLDFLFLSLQKDKPPILTREDICRLLQDQGRQEINSRLSQSIDAIAKWTGILKIVEKNFGVHFVDKKYLDEENDIFLEHIDMYVVLKEMIYLWKHHLQIVEMVSQMQDSFLF